MEERIMVEKSSGAQWEISNPEAGKVNISGNVNICDSAIGQNGRWVRSFGPKFEV